jgi:hypothetical protein
MSQQETLDAIRALYDAFKQLDGLLDNHIALCQENYKKAA